MDDIVTYCTNLAASIHNLELVLDRLRDHTLLLNAEKCSLCCSPDPLKVEAVKNYTTPSNVKELKNSLGLAEYYKRFVQNSAKIDKPIHQLFKQGDDFKRGIKQEEAFETLKHLLIIDFVLQYPDFVKNLCYLLKRLKVRWVQYYHKEISEKIDR